MNLSFSTIFLLLIIKFSTNMFDEVFGCQSSQMNPPVSIPASRQNAQQFADNSISKDQPRKIPPKIPNNYLTLDLDNDTEGGEDKIMLDDQNDQRASLKGAKNVEKIQALDIISTNISTDISSTISTTTIITTTQQNCNTARVLAVSTLPYEEATVQQEFTSLMAKLGLLESFLGIKLASFGEYSVQPIREGQFLALQIFFSFFNGDCGQMRDFAAKTVSYSKEIEYATFECRCGEGWMISKIH